MKDANNSLSFKLSSPTRENIVNWVNGGYGFLRESKAMIQRSFELCGITATNPGLVRNVFFFFLIMANVQLGSDWTDDHHHLFEY